MSEPRSHECCNGTLGSALRAFQRLLVQPWRTASGRLAVLLLAGCLLEVTEGRASEPIYYGYPFHRPRIAACEQLFQRGQYPEWVDCMVGQLPPVDPARRAEFGEFYDPRQWKNCQLKVGPGRRGCERFILRRRPEPEYWPSGVDPSRLKWPEPPSQAVYRRGMSAKEYFDALCKAEAGDFITRKVTGTEGVYMIRPRIRPTDDELKDRYVLSDPHGAVAGEFITDSAHMLVHPRRFRFVERPNVTYKSFLPTSFPLVAPYLRVTGEGLNDLGYANLSERADTAIQARYGFTWRGIQRANDRALGIAGGELAIVDFQTMEIIALRRGFIRSGKAGNVWWYGGHLCPVSGQAAVFSEFRFVTDVLRSGTGEQQGATLGR